MTTLTDVIALDDAKVKQATLKKLFMPWSQDVVIDGFEREALAVLLNISSNHKKDKCDDLLDITRAKKYLKNKANHSLFLAEVKWFHTHNLKFPDCRVNGQRLIAKPILTDESFISSSTLEASLGWAHDGASYRHPIWLLSPFSWQSKTVTILSLIEQKDPVWLEILYEFGLSCEQLKHIQSILLTDLPKETLPTSVSTFSKQVRFPWNNDYVSITPVVSHSIQRELEVRSRAKESKLQFTSTFLPNPQNIGFLCGSVGGHVQVLDYPLGVEFNPDQTLVASRQKKGRYFDDYQITNLKICQVLSHLVEIDPLKTQKQRDRARKVQTNILRKQIALWMLPLLELRDIKDATPEDKIPEYHDPLVQAFMTQPESEFTSLSSKFNRHIHFIFQKNKYTAKFAYHPNLINVVKSQIDWILEKISKDNSQDVYVNSEQYIYLSHLRVQDAVAMSSPYLSGAPSLSAIWGFMHQYQRKLNELVNGDFQFEFSSFSLFVRSENIQNTAKLTEPKSPIKKRTISNIKRPAIIGQRLSDLEIDLIIRVNSNKQIVSLLSELKAALPEVFAGGVIYQPPISLNINWLRTFTSKSELFYIIKGLPAYGCWLYPSNQQPKTFDELEDFLNDNVDIIPVSMGYHFLERPTSRENALTESHAYAENVLGIAERLNPIDVRLNRREQFFSNAFWGIESKPETILIKQYKG